MMPDPITDDEVASLRADTPGCATVAHLNNAGASLMPRPVWDAVRTHLESELTCGGYEAAADAAPAIQDTYAALADLVGAHADEIAVAENATRAWDMAFYGVDVQPGDRILTGHAEYVSQHLALLHVARRTGATVEVVPDDEHGQLSVEALSAAMDERVRVVSLVHVPTFGGLVNPAAEVGRVVRQHPRALYFLDACQSAGQLPLNVDQIGCDVLSAPGRKFLRGPRGTGFLYVRRERLGEIAPPFLDARGVDWTVADDYRVHDTARRFETWDTFVAGRIGLGVAARYALTIGLERIATRVAVLAEELRALLAEIDGVTIRDTGQVRCAIVTFTVDGVAPQAVAAAARAQRINVNTIGAGDARLSFDPRGIAEVVRSSVHYFTTRDELERFAGVVRTVARAG
jgi:cysteine desulfurase/selenocysteine lyase